MRGQTVDFKRKIHPDINFVIPPCCLSARMDVNGYTKTTTGVVLGSCVLDLLNIDVTGLETRC